MTDDERKALELVEGGLELLRNAIVNNDPHREIEFRVRDLLAEVRGILAGHAKAVAAIKRVSLAEHLASGR